MSKAARTYMFQFGASMLLYAVLLIGMIYLVSEIPMKNKLHVLRAERKWSQADLAEHLGVSRQTINALENGKYDPSLPLAFKIAKIFSMPIEEIFYPNEEEILGKA